MSEAENFSVLLSRNQPRDPVALAKALAAARKTPLQDQMGFAKNCWGILAESAKGQEADSLSQALRTAGIETVVCPAAKLVPLPAAEGVSTLSALPTAELVLLAAAAIPVTTTTTKLEKKGPTA